MLFFRQSAAEIGRIKRVPIAIVEHPLPIDRRLIQEDFLDRNNLRLLELDRVNEVFWRLKPSDGEPFVVERAVDAQNRIANLLEDFFSVRRRIAAAKPVTHLVVRQGRKRTDIQKRAIDADHIKDAQRARSEILNVTLLRRVSLARATHLSGGRAASEVRLEAPKSGSVDPVTFRQRLAAQLLVGAGERPILDERKAAIRHLVDLRMQTVREAINPHPGVFEERLDVADFTKRPRTVGALKVRAAVRSPAAAIAVEIERRVGDRGDILEQNAGDAFAARNPATKARKTVCPSDHSPFSGT